MPSNLGELARRERLENGAFMADQDLGMRHADFLEAVNGTDHDQPVS